MYSFEVSHEKQYDFFGTIWGVTYISGMPIFLVGEENHRYVKPMNKKTSYNMVSTNFDGVKEPYMSIFRVVASKSKEVKKSDKQKNK